MGEVKVSDGFYSYGNVFRNMKYDLKQNMVNCMPVPSLEHIALVRIAINLWQQDIRDEIECVPTSYIEPDTALTRLMKCMIIFEERAVEKLSHLELPLNSKEALERMIYKIQKEICNYFFTGETDFFDTLNKVEIYWNNFSWTDQGTINYFETAIQIIDNTNLSIKDKFIIACHNCLETRIRDLIKKLSEDFINDIVKDMEESFCPVLYWIFLIRGENERFSSITNGVPANEFILKWAIQNQRRVAVQYIWENLADAGMKELLIEFLNFAIDLPLSDNTMLYLFNQLKDKQLEEMCMTMSYQLLRTLHCISRWSNDVLLIEKFVLNFIKTKNVFDAFEIVMLCRHEDFLYLKQYINLWNEFTLHFKIDIKEKFKEICEKYFNKLMLEENDMVTSKLLLSMGTLEEQKEVIYGDKGMLACAHFMSRNDPEFFGEVLDEILVTEERIYLYKKMCFDLKRIIVCGGLILKEEYELLDELLIKFCLEEEIIIFKKELPYKNEASIIYDISFCDNFEEVELLTGVDKFLTWSFEGNKGEIASCKEVIYDLESDLYINHKDYFFERMKILIAEKAWDLVEEYWNFIFTASKDQVNAAKEKLACIKNFHYLSQEEHDVLLERYVTSRFEDDKLGKELKDSDC